MSLFKSLKNDTKRFKRKIGISIVYQPLPSFAEYHKTQFPLNLNFTSTQLIIVCILLMISFPSLTKLWGLNKIHIILDSISSFLVLKIYSTPTLIGRGFLMTNFSLTVKIKLKSDPEIKLKYQDNFLDKNQTWHEQSK